MNRKERRYRMFKKDRQAVEIIYKKDDKGELILDINKQPILVAYLHPTKGWKGNTRKLRRKQ